MQGKPSDDAITEDKRIYRSRDSTDDAAERNYLISQGVNGTSKNVWNLKIQRRMPHRIDLQNWNNVAYMLTSISRTV